MNGRSPVIARPPTLANYFAASDYVKWDLGRGVLRSRGGARLIAFPQEFTTGLLNGLEDECGEAWHVVMYRCGEWWGKREMERLEKDLGAFYQEELKSLPSAHAHASLAEAWALHGWGRLSFDMADIERGIMHARVESSQIASAFLATGKDAKGRCVCSLLSGVLAGMFIHMSKAELAAHELTCIARGDESCRFVLGLKTRMANVPEQIRKKASVDEILGTLRSGA